jgi:hypothetical protein
MSNESAGTMLSRAMLRRLLMQGGGAMFSSDADSDAEDRDGDGDGEEVRCGLATVVLV